RQVEALMNGSVAFEAQRDLVVAGRHSETLEHAVEIVDDACVVPVDVYLRRVWLDEDANVGLRRGKVRVVAVRVWRGVPRTPRPEPRIVKKRIVEKPAADDDGCMDVTARLRIGLGRPHRRRKRRSREQDDEDGFPQHGSNPWAGATDPGAT